jgi:branched-chain amino acid aminotransferase
MIVFLNGKFLRDEEACISVNDHGFLYGDGVYETLRSYGGKIWQLDEHLLRLKKSARLLGLEFKYGTGKVKEWILKLLKMNGLKEASIRITLTRGANGGDFTGSKSATVLIAAKDLGGELKKVYKEGVDVVTVNFSRIFPEAKTVSLLPFIMGQREAKKRRAFEAVFVDGDEFVREGTVTNVFIVKDGEVLTPKTGILEGVTRDDVIKAARRRGISVIVRDFTLNHLLLADEAFITNAPRGIVPVKKVNGKKIGAGVRASRVRDSGVPGPMTKKMMEAFADYVKDNLGRK